MLKKRTSSSQLAKLEGGDKYNFNRMTYPSQGIASDSIPNYVIFYINVPTTASYNKQSIRVNANRNVDASNSAKLREKNGNNGSIAPLTLEDLGTITAGLAAENFLTASDPTDVLKVAGDTGQDALVAAAISGIFSQVGKRPKMNRIKTAIALYMPDTIVQTYGHDYDALSVTDAMGKFGRAQRGGSAIVGAGKAAVDAFKSNDVLGSLQGVVGGEDGSIANLGKGLGEVGKAFGTTFVGNPGGLEYLGRVGERTGVVGAGFTDLVLRSTGLALNPQLEMVYKQTRNRSFIFDFKLQPRSAKESRNIKNIIREFKRYAAPSLNRTNSFYFTIPAQFDIQFMFYKDGVNEENRYIGKISTCALENIDVNYSSAGPLAVFEDGSPVEIGLQLRFVEVDVLTKEAFEDGNGEVNIERDDGASF